MRQWEKEKLTYPLGLNSLTPNQYKSCYKRTKRLSKTRSIQLVIYIIYNLHAFTSPMKLSAANLASGEAI